MATDRDDDEGSAVAGGAAAALEAVVVSLRDAVRAVDLTQGGEADGGLIRSVGGTLRRAENLCAGLLAYAGRQPLVAADVELLPLLSSMADLLRHTLDARIDVTLSFDRGCPTCRMDASALEEALLRLVTNARDAMRDGGHLSLAAEPAHLPNGAPGVAISVRDSGVGMTADVAKRAASPFFTTKTDDPCAGLGLAAVDGFARQCGGTMTLESWPGSGTKVTLHLPC